MVEATGGRDLGNAEGGSGQKVTADLHTVIIQKGDRRLGQIFLKDLAAFATAHRSCSSNILQGDMLLIMLIDIRNHLLLYLDVRIIPAGYNIFFNITIFVDHTPYFIKISHQLKFMTAFFLSAAETDVLKNLCQLRTIVGMFPDDHMIGGVI